MTHPIADPPLPRGWWFATVFACFLCGQFVVSATGAAKPAFHISTVGNPENAVAHPGGGLALIGGGADVDAAFRWIVDRSDGGDVVVIRASGDGAYNDYLYNLGGTTKSLDSVATIVFRERSATFDEAVLGAIRDAEALIIAGGDQAEYLRLWRDTPLAATITARAREGMVVAGTSAGAMILGEHVYSAAKGSVVSRAALRNPFDPRVTLSFGLFALPGMDGVIVDTHFSERNRAGRLLAFLARLRKQSAVPVRGVGLDEQTALLIAPSGEATIVGDGRALLLDMRSTADRCRRGKPLTLREQPGAWAAAGDTADTADWNGSTLDQVTFTVVRGRVREALAD